MIWYKDKNDGIIISTRVRLARNLDRVPFPKAIAQKDIDPVLETLTESITKSNSTLSKDFDLFELDKMTPQEKTAELRGFERAVFRRVYGGAIAKKMYRLYEYEKVR